MQPRRAAWIAGAGLIALSERAWACPGCVAPDDESGMGYLLATLLMGLLPFAVLIASLLFVRKLVRSTESSPVPAESSGSGDLIS